VSPGYLVICWPLAQAIRIWNAALPHADIPAARRIIAGGIHTAQRLIAAPPQPAGDTAAVATVAPISCATRSPALRSNCLTWPRYRHLVRVSWSGPGAGIILNAISTYR